MQSLNQGLTRIDPAGLVSTCVSLLRCLPEDHSETQRAELLIPDKDSHLRPFSKTYYNDIWEDVWLMKKDEQFIAHQLLDEVVRKLNLNRLGLEYAELLDIGPNMGKTPIMTVRRALEQ
jgi:hypothetical protein